MLIQNASMRLTSFTDYGLRVLMRLADEPGQLFTTDEMATELAISRHHLTKVVRQLAAAGLVVTSRGAGGGLRLAKPAHEISIGEVVRILERRHAMVECFRNDGGTCVLTPQCRLKEHLAAAHEVFLAKLEETPLSQIAYPGPAKCGIPQAGSQHAHVRS